MEKFNFNHFQTSTFFHVIFMKKYCIFLFFLFFILISSVSAASNIENITLDNYNGFLEESDMDSLSISPINDEISVSENEDILTSSEELITNPNFDDAIDYGNGNVSISGWTYTPASNGKGTIKVENDGDEHGNYIRLSNTQGGFSSIDRISALSQKIDLTNILNITFEIKKGGQNVGYNFDEINVQTNMRIDTSLPLNQWVNYTIDTSSLTGVHELFLISAQIRDGFCIDSFTYCLEESKADVEINNYVNNPVKFNYTTTDNITNWFWDFGDGTYSNLSNPVHTYSEIGTYNAKLTMSNDTDSKNISYSVDIIEKVIADFNYYEPYSNRVDFTDLSSGNPISWTWDWGDGKTSTYYSKNSFFYYYSSGALGSFDVTLTVTDKFGNTSSITKKGIVKFYNSVAYPISVDSFENSADGWTLGDGASLSTDFHQGNDGKYSIGLSEDTYIEKIINFDNIDSISLYAYSTHESGGLRYINLYIDGNQVVHDGIYHYGWSPISYSTSNLVGNHNVTLKSNDGVYFDTITLKTNSYYLANFTTAITDINGEDITVKFTDNSYGTYNGFLWTFDGENTSTLQNPTFTFKKGTHTVTLIIYRDGIKMSSITKDLNLDLPTIADNSYATIQEAINAANANDVIDIPNMDYKFSENLLINKSLTLNFNGAVLSAKDTSIPLFNITEGATVTVTNIGLDKDTTLVTDSNSKLIIRDSDIGVNLALSEGNVDLLDDSFNNSVLTIAANTNIANSTISSGAVIVNNGKSKIFNTTINGCDVAITQTAGELDIISNVITDNNIAINVTGGTKTNIEYNLIYSNAKFGLVYVGENVTNANNWWGNKDEPSSFNGKNLSDSYYDIYRLGEDSPLFNSYLTLTFNVSENMMETNKDYQVSIEALTDKGEKVTGYLKTIDLEITSDGNIYHAVLENGVGKFTITAPNVEANNLTLTVDGNNYLLNTPVKEIVTSIIKITGVDGNLTVHGVLKDSKGNVLGNAIVNYKIGNDEVQNTTTNPDGEFTLKAVNGATVSVSYDGNSYTIGSDDSITLSDIASNQEDNKTVSELQTQLKDAQDNASQLNDKLDNLTVQLNEAQKTIQNLSSDISTTVSANDLTIKALDSGNIQVTLKDANNNLLTNKSVQVIINGVTYTGTTNNNGIASINVKFASAGTYNAVVSFLGDDKYKGSISTSKVVVNKKAAALTVKKATLKVKKVKKIKVTLKSDGKAVAGKTITIKVNKKTFKAKTNKNGVATIKVKVTKKGKFNAVVKFAGDNTYKGVTKKVKLNVKK